MSRAIFDNRERESEIQGVNSDGTVRLFIYNVGFIKEARVIRDGKGRSTKAQGEEDNHEAQEVNKVQKAKEERVLTWTEQY